MFKRWAAIWRNRRAANKIAGAYIYVFEQALRSQEYYEENRDTLSILAAASNNLWAQYQVLRQN